MSAHAHPLPPPAVEAIKSAAFHLFIAKYYSLAATVMLVYDNIVTFDREVEAVWKSKWTAVKCLFFFNRYANIVAYVVSWVSINSNWPTSVCSRYVHFPGIFNLLQQVAIGAILILFTWALYERSNIVLGLVVATYVTQIVLIGWSISATTMVKLPPPFVGCIYAGKKGSGIRVITSWIVQLAFIAVVFGLMIWKAWRLSKARVRAPLIDVMTKDGLKYFGIIFTANFVTVMNFVLVKARDLKSLHATFSALITVVMINRLILSIREEAVKPRTTLDGQKYLHSTLIDALYTETGTTQFANTWRVARPTDTEFTEEHELSSGRVYP